MTSLGVWAGAFALIVSGTDRASSGARIAPTHTGAAAPASDYAAMLREIATRGPDYYGDTGTNSNNYKKNGKNADASDSKANVGDRARDASTGNRTRVTVANASTQAPANQGLFSSTISTLPAATSTTGDAPSTSTTSTTTTTVGKPGPTGPIISLDDSRLTPAQRDAAKALIDRTSITMSLFPTEQSVLDAGYQWVGDTDEFGFETYVKSSYLADGRELDESHIESIVLQRDVSGAAKVVAAVYVLEPSKTMTDVPDIAGALTTWHARDDLCRAGNTFSPRLDDGTCATGTLPVVLPPSLHVWLVPQPCGPFADIAADRTTCKV